MTTAEETARSSLGEELRRGREELRSVGGAIGGIADDLRGLAAAESALARAEMQDSMSAVVRLAAFGAAAAVLAVIGVVFVFRTIMAGLDEAGLTQWAAALITALIALALAAGLGLYARKQMADVTLVPRRTMDSLKEDVAWVREQTRRNSA